MAGLFGWLLVFFCLVSLLAILGYQLMCLMDLEFDFINPYDSAARINMLILPEVAIQGILCAIYLVTGCWWMFLLSVPYLYYNLRLYRRREHLADVTEIYNQLNREKNRRLFKLSYIIILLILSLFWLLWTVGEDDE